MRLDGHAMQATIHIHEGLLIPDLLREAPQTRPVLDRYGLHGCGGDSGPMETLGFFARAHDVPLPQLRRELNEAAEELQPAEAAPAKAEAADAIYRPFFKAGIAVILTLGASWGALLLLRIGFLKDFTAVSLHEVNAHGHAQIFGWVGLFVMGFAYQAFPRFKHTTLAWPKLAFASFLLMLGGIILRSVSQAALERAPVLLFTGLAGSIIGIAAIALFIAIVWKTLRASGKGFAFYDYYILAALGWFFVQAVYGAVYFAATALAPNRDALLDLVAMWQAPLRDIQIHGFAMLMILGVSQRMFHNFYQFPAPSKRLSLGVLAALNIGLLCEVAGFVMMRAQGHAWAGLWYTGVLLMAGGVVALVLNWRIFGKSGESDRSLKFLRVAYGWLLVSMAMTVLLPLHQFGLLQNFAPESHAAEIGFSHAYYGAIRHAITVGFISLMIVGVTAKVVPTLMGVDLHRLSGLWLPFILINTGCAMRVGFQTLTDFHDLAFPVAGMSGLLEVSGLAIWGVHLWRIMNGWQPEGAAVAQQRVAHEPLSGAIPIAAHHVVGEVIRVHPHLLDVFITHGFRPLANPVLRRSLAHKVTIARACQLADVDCEALLAALNRERGLASAPVLPGGRQTAAGTM